MKKNLIGIEKVCRCIRTNKRKVESARLRPERKKAHIACGAPRNWHSKRNRISLDRILEIISGIISEIVLEIILTNTLY